MKISPLVRLTIVFVVALGSGLYIYRKMDLEVKMLLVGGLVLGYILSWFAGKAYLRQQNLK